MAPNESILDFTNKFNGLTKCLISLGMKIDNHEIVGNYMIAMKTKHQELSGRFDI